MPILPSEPAVYPPDLLTGDGAPAGERVWWAVYTKARQEKALARELVKMEIPFYLPLIPKTSMQRGRRQESLIPLFNGYVFLFASDGERQRALTTNRISRTLLSSDSGELFHDLRQVQRLIESRAPLTVESRLTPGRRVRVRSGALMGAEGLVEARRGGCRLIVAVRFLQQGVSIEIDDFLLEPLD